MQHVFFRIHTYITHQLKTIRSRKGYGIHSPFAYDFIRDIINPEKSSYFYCYDAIERLRYRLRLNNKRIILDNGDYSTVKRVAKTSASPNRDGQLLFRTSLFMQSKAILELGTSLGLGTAYLSCANQAAKVISVDHNASVQNIAKENAKLLKLNNITFINGKFVDKLPSILKRIEKLDLMFCDGHHQGDATLDYFNLTKERSHAQSVFIFHDIHWSKDMYQAWLEIIKDPLVSLSIECYNCGFIFFNPELNKQHYLV